jgi:iron complex outermembrane receptor protein
MMRLLLLWLMLISSSSVAQTGFVSGTVLDESSGEKISGATVIPSYNRNAGTITAEGEFNLELPQGNQLFFISSIGYMTDTVEMNVKAGENYFITILLPPSPYELDKTVITAGKYEQAWEEVTVSMEVLSSKYLDEKNITNAAQALEQIPGLNILDEEPQIRGGSGFAFGVGTRAITLIDGIPILSGDAGKPEWSFIPLESLHQVEVMKGSASVMYGSSALTGAINFLTAYPAEPSLTKIRFYSGAYSEPKNALAKWWTGLAAFSGINLLQSWKRETFDLQLGAQLLYDHNFIGPPLPDASLPFEQDTLNEKDVAEESARLNFSFRYRPRNQAGLSFGMNGNFMKQNSNFSLVWGDARENIYRAFPGTLTLSNSFQFYLDPFLNWFAPNGLEHRLRTRLYVTDNQNSNSQSNASEVLYAEYQLAKYFTAPAHLRFTAGAISQTVFSQAQLFSASGSPNNNLQNAAIYLQLDKELGGVLNVSAGLRGEYFEINGVEDVVRPVFRAGANLKLTEKTFLRSSYGQGFRFPTITEKFIHTSAGGLTVFPNPELNPETSWSWEAGIKQFLSIHSFQMIADAALFWNEYENTIEYNYAIWEPDSAGFKFINTGRTRVRGIDVSFSMNGNISRSVKLNSIIGYTYSLPQSADPRHVYATDNPGEGFIPNQLSYASTSSDTSRYILKYRFTHLAKADVSATIKKFSAGYSIRYYSFMQNIDQTFLDIDREGQLPTGITQYRNENNQGTLIHDLRLGIEFRRNYVASLLLNNLFNETYSLRPLKIESMRTVAIQLRAVL